MIRRTFQWLLLLLVFTGPLMAERWRIASYNVRNYLEMGRRVDGYWKEDYPKPESERTALRQVIRDVAPDILALQEMGSALHLAELQSDLRREGLDYPFAALAEAADEHRHLALLSRIEPLSWTVHDGLDFNYFEEREVVKRGLLEAVFEHEGFRWHLFVVHLKSRYEDRSEDPLSATRREREARTIRDFLRERFPDPQEARYLVIGDFNDHPDSGPVRRFLEVSGQDLAYLVDAADSRGETWTFNYRRRDLYERVDFAVASPGLYRRIPGRRGYLADRYPQSRAASDHRLLWLELNLR